MHSVYLGVIKNIFSYWFESNLSEKYSLKSRLNEINERLLRFKPPSYINYVPRRIALFKLWRAHEFMNFILVYAVLFFYKIMSGEYHDIIHGIMSIYYY